MAKETSLLTPSSLALLLFEIQPQHLLLNRRGKEECEYTSISCVSFYCRDF
jgi:hypothetical protein